MSSRPSQLFGKRYQIHLADSLTLTKVLASRLFESTLRIKSTKWISVTNGWKLSWTKSGSISRRTSYIHLSTTSKARTGASYSSNSLRLSSMNSTCALSASSTLASSGSIGIGSSSGSCIIDNCLTARASLRGRMPTKI